jgi:hypothetical protein
MMSLTSSLVRSGLIAAAAVVWLPPASFAAPVFPDLGSVSAGRSGPDQPILVWQGEGRDHGPGYRFWPRVGGGGGGHWGGGWGGGGWGGGRWHGGWGHGGYWGPGWGWGGWGSGFALGLGLGVPLGYYGGYAPYYDGYDSGYDDPPVYRPRVYRPRVYNAPRSYNHGSTFGQCDNVYQTGPVYSGCR